METKQYETNSLGYKLKFNGPATVEAYDIAAGKTGACLEDAVENTIYRSTLPEWQDEFAKAVEKATGVTRAVNKEQTDKAKARSKTPDKVKDIMETVKTYVARATAGLDDAAKAALATSAQSAADAILVDPAPSKRQAGPDKNLLAKADSLLTLPTDALEAKVSALLTEVDGFDLAREEDGKPERTSLARLVGAVLDARLATI